MNMFATSLRCLRCGTDYPFEPTAYVCPSCGPGDEQNDPGILDVCYDYDSASVAMRNGPGAANQRTDIFRYLPLLPVAGPGPVLPAGGTPLIPAPRIARRLGLDALYLKDETRNPTRCLKDRATAVGVSMALELSRKDVYCASAGNAAISLAGYSAHAGLNCHAYVPNNASPTRLAWLRRYGANLHVSSGNYDQAYAEAEADGAENGWYSRNCAFNPFLVEGKKTVSFEIGEQLGWQTPDLVVSPVGDGCTLGAIGKGFRELTEIGLTERVPRLVGVQSEAIQPLVRRLAGQEPGDDGGSTLAASIAVRQPRNAIRLLDEMEASHGALLAVPDEAMTEAQRLLAEEAGVVAELTSAGTLAGLIKLAAQESLAGLTAVLVITGGRLDGED